MGLKREGHLAVLGGGSWGTALALVGIEAGHAVRLWARRPELAHEIAGGRNERYLPDTPLPTGIDASSDLEKVVQGAALVLLAVPCRAVRASCEQLAAIAGSGSIPVVCAAKGLERESASRMSEVMAASLPSPTSAHAVLLGPSHAEEVARRHPTAVVVSGGEGSVRARIQEHLSTPVFRVYTNDDLIGVEYAGALKNVLAIAAGICDGLGLGDNTKGALLTRGVTEIARLGVASGARRETFFGLAGIGDVITTCLSRHSRNRALGEHVARGMPLEDAIAAIGQVVEGAETARLVGDLATRFGVDLPISAKVQSVLFAGSDPAQAIDDLMTRSLKSESEV